MNYQLNSKGQASRSLFINLNLSVAKDDMVAIVGPNGVGKTTLTKIILGILQADSGSVMVDDRAVSDYRRSEIGGKIGYLFQNPLLQLFNQTIEEELLFTYAIQDQLDDQVQHRYETVLEEMSLEEVVKTPVFHLSQGEKQRLAIGTLLMNDPDFMILDEPTSGLDHHRKETLKNRLLDLHMAGMGMMIVTHDYAFIEDLPIKILTFKDGGVIYES